MAYRQPNQPLVDPNLQAPWRTQSTGPYNPSGSSNAIMEGMLPNTQIPGMTTRPTGPQTYNIGVQTSQKNGLLNSLMSPEALAAMGMGGLGFVGQMMNNSHDSQQQGMNREMQMRQLLASIATNQMDDQRTRQLGYLNSTQMDPVSQSRDLFSANLLRDVAGHGPTHYAGDGSGAQNPFSVSQGTMNFLSPGALAENASRFYGAAGSVDPNQAHPDLAAMGFGPEGTARQAGMDQTINAAGQRAQQLQQERKNALMQSIQPQPQQQHPSKKSGILKLLGGIGMGALAFVPGMQPLAPYLLGSGFGMATGGLKGAAVGAAGAGVGQAGDYFKRPSGK